MDNNNPIGVEEGETWFHVPSGLICCCESAESNPEGTTYVRFVDLADGKEVAYWNYEEWNESPAQAIEVMGAIMGLMISTKGL